MKESSIDGASKSNKYQVVGFIYRLSARCVLNIPRHATIGDFNIAHLHPQQPSFALKRRASHYEHLIERLFRAFRVPSHLICSSRRVQVVAVFGRRGVHRTSWKLTDFLDDSFKHACTFKFCSSLSIPRGHHYSWQPAVILSSLSWRPDQLRVLKQTMDLFIDTLNFQKRTLGFYLFSLNLCDIFLRN